MELFKSKYERLHKALDADEYTKDQEWATKSGSSHPQDYISRENINIEEAIELYEFSIR